MAQHDRDGLVQAAVDHLGASADETGEADLIFDRGSIVVAEGVAFMKEAFAKAKKIEGFRWVLINRGDLFAASQLSIGSKIGILDAGGRVLKAADSPRKKV